LISWKQEGCGKLCCARPFALACACPATTTGHCLKPGAGPANKQAMHPQRD
jgi:hypothetical protein